MPKYRVGLSFEITGITYVEIEADTEDAAAEMGERDGEEYVTQAVRDGAGTCEVECCDVLPPKAG